jgi:hypothetical protein
MAHLAQTAAAGRRAAAMKNKKTKNASSAALP